MGTSQKENNTNRLKPFVLLAVAVGILYHGALVLRPEHLLPDRPFRDDAFYALTIARNLARGNGLSTAGGEIATNGFQPFFVFISSIPFLFTEHRYLPLRMIHLIHLLVHLLSALVLYRLIGLFTRREGTRWTAVAFWMVSFNVLKLGSNGLETGFYLLMILNCSYLYLTRVLDGERTRDHLLFGLVLGLTTLTRIDAGFLCLSFGLHYLVYNRAFSPGSMRRLLAPVLWLIPWLVVTAPWWVYNYELTGSPIPTSGMMQTMQRTTGSLVSAPRVLVNLDYSVNALLDQAWLFVVTPLRFIKNINRFSLYWNVARGLLLAAVVVWLTYRAKPVKPESSPGMPVARIMFYPVFLLMLIIYYNFFFNVAWFINRYTIPCIVASVFVWVFVLERFRPLYVKLWITAGVAATLIIGGYSYPRSYNSMYTEHYGWVRAHTSGGTWVAAMQTGTLGYFHDLTINMDGKVNPEIAELEGGTKGSYLQAKGVRYFIDWRDMSIFTDPGFLRYYEFLEEHGRCFVFVQRN